MKKEMNYKTISLTVSVLVICFAIAFYAVGWTEPTVAPPGGNVDTPLNTSSVGQSKAGGLILNTGGAVNGLIVDKGNVGIGTTGPIEKLDVRGDILIGRDIYSYGEGGRIRHDADYFGVNFDAFILEKVDDDTGVAGGIVLGFATSNSDNTFPVSDPPPAGWATIHTPAMVIRGNGNIGIGITGPSEKLEIYSNKACGSGNFGKIEFSDGSERVRIGINRTLCNAGADIVFETEGTNGNMYERMRINENGNVGIGTTSPSEKLEVSGNIEASGSICANGGADCIGGGSGAVTGSVIGGGSRCSGCETVWGSAYCSGGMVTCPSGSTMRSTGSKVEAWCTRIYYICIKD